MVRPAPQPIAEIVTGVPVPPALAEIEQTLAELRERLDELAEHDRLAQNKLTPQNSYQIGQLRQRVRERRRAAAERIDAEVRRREELRTQHVSRLIIALTP